MNPNYSAVSSTWVPSLPYLTWNPRFSCNCGWLQIGFHSLGYLRDRIFTIFSINPNCNVD